MRNVFFSLTYFTLHSLTLLADPYPYAQSPSNTAYPYGPQKETTAPTPEHKTLKTEHCYRFALKHREANGIGYNQGYSSLDGFFLFSSMGNWYPYFDVRAHLFNNGRPAANLGFGLRYLPQSTGAVFGINGFFDLKNTSHSTFEQVGGGIEILGCKWLFRANGYFPIFTKNNLYSLGFEEFQGHHAIFRADHEIAFKGFDVSLGRILVQKRKWDLSSTLDGYMFFADYHSRAIGGMLKIKSHMFRFFSLEGTASYDSYFKTLFQIQAAVAVPFGKRLKLEQKGLSKRQKLCLSRRLADEVDRFEMIVSDKHPIDSIAKDPRTGDDLHIVFVNNTELSEGNGTAETPYRSLAEAEAHSSPWDMIYVYSGNNTALHMDHGIHLKEGQWLQGSSFPFLVDTAFGSLYVPEQTSTLPTIANTGATVTLANNNIVTGFTLRSATVNIAGTDIQNTLITNNKLRDSADFDIILTNVSGDIILKNNTSFSSKGLSLHTAYAANVKLDSNNFANVGAFNMDISFEGSSNSTLAITNRNEFHDSVGGTLIIAKDNATLTTSIENNLFTAIPDAAPYTLKLIASGNSNVNGTIFSNFFGSSAPGLILESNSFGNANWTVRRNNATYTGHNSPIYPISVETNGSSTTTLNLTQNRATAQGFSLDNNSGTATFNATSSNSALSGIEAVNIGTFTTSGTINYTPP